ncbi:terpene synthase family protein [Phaeacidiphilus oryzae]|uniref:terpene synthase family protein n=1 Tax=Phaeacidiphilus oryzae TaxID=348818 RepID=UPI000566BF02|nr:hypothetical protein [Phaeacidiphilus oryzae]
MTAPAGRAEPDEPDEPDEPVLPDLGRTFPGPFPKSPHAGYAAAETGRWLARFPLLEPAAAEALRDITCRGVAVTYPEADPDGLALAAALFVWFVALDDTHAETAAAADPAAYVRRIAGLLPVLGGGPAGPADDPFGAALADLLARLRERAGPALRHRLAGDLRDTLTATVWEAHVLSDPESVPLAEYLTLRRYTVLAPAAATMAEVLAPDPAGERALESEPARRLREAVCDLAGWLNDLASYRRERRRAAEPLSLPTVLRNARRCSLPEAFAEASRMCEERAAEARALIGELTADPAGPLAGYAARLGAVVHSYAWHIAHARYAG